MLSDEEIRLAGDAYLLRASETNGDDKWFAPAHELEDAARALHSREYLDRRWRGPDPVYRYSDVALSAYELAATMAAAANNAN